MRTEETKATKIWFIRNAFWSYIYTQDILILDSKSYRYNMLTNYEYIINDPCYRYTLGILTNPSDLPMRPYPV